MLQNTCLEMFEAMIGKVGFRKNQLHIPCKWGPDIIPFDPLVLQLFWTTVYCSAWKDDCFEREPRYVSMTQLSWWFTSCEFATISLLHASTLWHINAFHGRKLDATTWLAFWFSWPGILQPICVDIKINFLYCISSAIALVLDNDLCFMHFSTDLKKWNHDIHHLSRNLIHFLDRIIVVVSFSTFFRFAACVELVCPILLGIG